MVPLIFEMLAKSGFCSDARAQFFSNACIVWIKCSNFRTLRAEISHIDTKNVRGDNGEISARRIRFLQLQKK